ncbi:MarR family transcriptional regulator [Rathayibacter rathayi]|uniref:MarR family transcriptional regulator n=1 Tax=Rathayibacter rathayi TaxID=33887 RepID=A0ABD6WB99_RATRA|nr:MarR family winged helix-turn-helix transcriptional regulator [Rathayibacter rathayi]AZZ47902.1 MarR family transcriptional regulator [Rathayibacter rathayi]MWV75175.1 MarR family transcriptional regulator [Rathayibacter rathayi NCPPB 2980 = VKM Ac-1601]PPF15551.1 MarR family transcriptional regulator [Rathayibacter rathayi]PPF26030.1 MarR family transcriptional regulator [Rathayibacter rathayi]PPF51308.1 MarR family transcriptional regulator [Rathayibacter rathayi]
MSAAAPSAEALHEVEEQLTVLAVQVRLAVRDAAASIDPALPPFGLRLLRMLERCGPVHSGAAAERLGVDRSAISRQARQLADLGLVDMTSDPADGRARFLSLSAAGCERMRDLGGQQRQRMQEALSAWPEADLRAFAGYLERLTAAK